MSPLTQGVKKLMHDGLVGEAAVVQVKALGPPKPHPSQVAEAGAA